MANFTTFLIVSTVCLLAFTSGLPVLDISDLQLLPPEEGQDMDNEASLQMIKPVSVDTSNRCPSCLPDALLGRSW